VPRSAQRARPDIPDPAQAHVAQRANSGFAPTRPTPRKLGKSEAVPVPTNCLIIATGNNLTFRGDITRRVVVCRLDARQERPDERQFSFDPGEVARQQRGELVVGR
jgi:hypothetical protein